MAMEKKMVNEKALDINNDALEAAMQELIKENNKDNMVKMMDLMRTARFLVPAEFPKNMSREITESEYEMLKSIEEIDTTAAIDAYTEELIKEGMI